jgi:poly(ADP-ribose) glycohydrolase ARH3
MRDDGATRMRDRFRGALLGAAVGDALGAPFEGGPPVGLDRLARLDHEPGPLRYTDDTHMPLGMAESLLERDGFDGAHMAGVFARNFEAEPWRGYGPGPPRVFRLLREGIAWDAAGRTLFGGSGSYGNGAAMRAVPAGLFHPGDPDRAAAIAAQAARITHAHPLGIEGAALQARAVAILVGSESPPAPEDLLRDLRAAARTDPFREALDRIPALPPEATPREIAHALGNGIEAHRSVPAALYAALRHPDSFAGAVTFAIALGGDTDTIACMAGALAGARLGESEIPARWRDQVEGAQTLRALADALHARRSAA